MDYDLYKLQICKFIYQKYPYQSTLTDYQYLSQSLHNTISIDEVKRLCSEIESETKILVTKGHSVGMTPKGIEIMKNLGGNPTSYGLIVDATKTKFAKTKTSGYPSGSISGWFHKWLYPIIILVAGIVISAIFLS